MTGNNFAEQSLPPYGEPAARQLLTHLSRRGFPYGSPPVKRDVGIQGYAGMKNGGKTTGTPPNDGESWGLSNP